MANNKIAVKVFLGCLCCFVLIMGLNAADGTSGSGSTGSSGTANCTTVGETQEKYTADSNCGYSTQTRTCCSNKYWSGWDEPCPGAVQLVAVRSMESLTLECGGYYGAYVDGVCKCTGLLPSITVPYPKCPASNICDGKSVGYKCYERYSPTAEEVAKREYDGRQGGIYYPKGYGYMDGPGCYYRDINNDMGFAACDICSGTGSGSTGGGSGAKGPGNWVHRWITGGSFTVNVVTCKEQTSTGGGSQI